MAADDLKLYHAAASPNSRRVRIFIAEKGVTVPLVPVDLGKGEQHSDAYPRYQSATPRARTRFGGRHRDR
jgi:glutathione S-transferase